MTRKKTTSAKKRNQPPAAATAAAGATTPTTRDSYKTTIFPGDRVNELFLDNGKHIDVVHVVKYMPHAVQQLKKGTMSPDQFGQDVAAAFVEHFRVSTGFLFTFDIIILSICQDFCWPGPAEKTAPTEMDLRFVSRMAALFREEYDKFKDMPDGAFVEAAVVALQTSLEKTCRTLSAQMDREYFNNKTGAFLRWCPLYGILSAKKFVCVVETWSCLENLTEYLTKAREAKRISDRVKRDAFLVGFAVVENVDEAWVECWECGKQGKMLPHCSQCFVAQYCGQNCQVKAWGRHKTMCTENKNVYNYLLENLSTVDEAHKTGTIHGVHLNFSQDCSTTQLMMSASHKPTIVHISGLQVDGPSMEYFYQNLGHIVRGEWWLWSVTDPSLAFANRWSKDVCHICNMLSYDLHGYVASKTNGIVTSETIEENVMAHPFFWFINKMPAEIFLKFYHERDLGKDLMWRENLVNAITAKGRAMIKEMENQIL